MILHNNSHNPLLANGRATYVEVQLSNNFYNNMKEVSSKTTMILQPKFNQNELSVARKLLHLGQVHSNSQTVGTKIEYKHNYDNHMINVILD